MAAAGHRSRSNPQSERQAMLTATAAFRTNLTRQAQ
jgi:hypothetical protein